MLFVTGDCHGGYERFTKRRFPLQKELGKEDYVLICGDFGYAESNMGNIGVLNQRNFTTLWLDGNHENFDLLKERKVEMWHGGKVQYIAPSVLHLMRGQVYELNGRRLFTFGGAASHDVEGGILEPSDSYLKLRKRRMKHMGLHYRVRYVDWWEEEMPTPEEMEEGRRNLERHHWSVDYIFTHCCATSTQTCLKIEQEEYPKNALTDYLEEIKQKCAYKKWYFGHYHQDEVVNAKETLLEESIERLF